MSHKTSKTTKIVQSMLLLPSRIRLLPYYCWQLEIPFLYPAAFRVSVQYCSHTWSRVLIPVKEGNCSTVLVEITAWPDGTESHWRRTYPRANRHGVDLHDNAVLYFFLRQVRPGQRLGFIPLALAVMPRMLDQPAASARSRSGRELRRQVRLCAELPDEWLDHYRVRGWQGAGARRRGRRSPARVVVAGGGIPLRAEQQGDHPD